MVTLWFKGVRESGVGHAVRAANLGEMDVEKLSKAGGVVVDRR